MKKKIFFILFIFLCFMIPVIAFASIDEFIVKANVENTRIEVGDTTKMGFTATLSPKKEPTLSLSFHDYDYTFENSGGFLQFYEKAVKLKYSSSNSSIATVDDKGVITGLSPGTVTITQKITFNLEPNIDMQRSSIAVSIVENNMCNTIYLKEYSGLDELLHKHSNETVTNEIKITVTASDSLYLCRLGAKPVPVKLASNLPSTEVNELPVGGWTNAAFSMTITETDDPTVKYTFSNSDYSHLAPLSFLASYASDNSAVAAVDKDGKVTGVSEGSANITVKLTFVLGDYNFVTPKKEGIVRLGTAPGTKYKVLECTRQVTFIVRSNRSLSNLVLTQGQSLPASNNQSIIRKLHSSDDSIVPGNWEGIVTGLRPGRVTMVYLYKGPGQETVMTPVEGFVTVIPVMAIHPETVTMYSDSQKELKVTFDTWYDGKKSGTWSVADAKIASIDQNGVVTGIKAGTTTATFTLDGSGANTSCTVVVKKSPLQVMPTALSLDIGAVGTLNVTFDSSYTGDWTGTWSVADNTVTAVSGYETPAVMINTRHSIPGMIGAKITALKSGTTKVTFTHSATGVTLPVSVTVKPGFSISPDPLTVYEGETGSLSAVFEDGYTDSKNGIWLIDDSTLASIDQNGVVMGIKSGTAIASYRIVPSSATSGNATSGTVTRLFLDEFLAKAASQSVKTAIINVKPGSFTVTFSGADTNPPAVKVKHDTTVPKPSDPSPSSSDVRFIGWSASPGGETIWDFDNNKVAQDMTLYAQWARKITTTHISVASPPTINGPDTIALTVGYADAHQAYTLSGNPAPSLAITANTAGATLSGNTLTIPAGLAAGSYSVALEASNLAGTATKTVTVNVTATPTQTAPTIDGTDTIQLTEGYNSTDYIYTLSGTPAPSLAITANTAGATLSGNTLTIPAGLAAGSYSVTLEASNLAGTATKTVTVNVTATPTQTAPAIDGPDTILLAEGYSSTNYIYTLSGSPAPSLAITTDTEYATLSGNTLTILEGYEAGSHSITLEASNSAGSVTKAVQIYVIRLSPTAINVNAGAIDYSESLYIFDGVSGRKYYFSLASKPSWVALSTAVLILNPPSGTSGDFQVDVAVKDEDGNSVTIPVTITVN